MRACVMAVTRHSVALPFDEGSMMAGTIDRPPRESSTLTTGRRSAGARTYTRELQGGKSHQAFISGEGIAFNCQDQLHFAL